MTRTEYLILLATSVILVLLTSVNFLVQTQTQKANTLAVRYENALNKVKQADSVLQQLVIRVAQGSDRDPRLRDILVRHKLSIVNNGQQGRSQ